MTPIATTNRLEIEIRGVVQGVGFRPFVYALATRFNLGGVVANRDGAVWIEVEGESESLESFYNELHEHPPALARIESIERRHSAPRGQLHFSIAASSAAGTAPIFISPDVAVCSDCLAEMRDPQDRRYQYPFIHCTNCGPRLTIVTGAPYDRERTTMARFAMCPPCRAEYEDPCDRRFHAQATACPDCGPRLMLRGAAGEILATDDPIRSFAEAIRDGKIGALKGLGGYHLVCSARDEAAVRFLRERKHREEKPLAIMVRDLAAAEAICDVEPRERELLRSTGAPIVLLRRKSGQTATIAPAVAPGNPHLGVMLPHTPLHHLLLDAVAPLPLVMTSGNRSDEPIAYRDDDALERLRGIADLFLTHDRPIHVRCDDSVVRMVSGSISPLRRSRGLAPAPVALPFSCPMPILAAGGQLKGTFALGRDRQAFLSHHLGDLDHLDAYEALLRDVALYEDLFAIEPRAVAHDLHPDYAATRYAASRGLPTIAVQHHHAHLASCMAEHGLQGPVIGVIFDGSGLGTDGHIWGGEFLVGDYAGFRRVAALRNVAMPGGEQAVREPWRMAAAHLLDAGCQLKWLESHTPSASLSSLQAMVGRQLHSPLTSSMGRLFDAVAALAGIRRRVSYEGQAAMELEWLATETKSDGSYAWEFNERDASSDDEPVDPLWTIDTRPLIRGITGDVERKVTPNVIARRFQSTIVEMIAETCAHVCRESGLREVVLSGGVFSNALLADESRTRLMETGFRVFTHEQVPPNDGGLSLGQLAVASRLLSSSH